MSREKGRLITIEHIVIHVHLTLPLNGLQYISNKAF